MILPTCLLMLALLSSPALARYSPLKAAQVRASGAAVQDFVPPGWVIEQQLEGELTANNKPDIVLNLIENLPSPDRKGYYDGFRALVILERIAPGQLRRLAVAATLLRDTDSFGTFGNPYAKPDIKISKGVLQIKHAWGSALATEQAVKFRYDPKLRRFVLIGEERLDMDRRFGRDTLTSSNYLTGERIIAKFHGGRRISEVKEKFPAGRIFLEDSDYQTP